MKEREVAMSDANEFEGAITRALDRKPEVVVPATTILPAGSSAITRPMSPAAPICV